MMMGITISLTGRLLSGAFSPAILFQSNEPGFWYDPSDVANLNWRRNLLTWTEDFSNAAWSKVNVTITANAAAAPDGTMSADRIVQDAGTRALNEDGPKVNVTVTGDKCFSVSAKQDTARYLAIGFSNGAGLTATAVFDLQAGTLSGSGFHPSVCSAITTSITSQGSGWYRCSLGLVGSMNITNIQHIAASTAPAGGSYNRNITGDGTSGVLIWGAQLEVGSVATEYQPITTVDAETIARFPTATLYRDTAGTQPVTTPGDTVALMLDKRQGLVLGSELVTNGDFSNGTTGWASSGSTLSIVNNKLRINATSLGGSATQTINTVAGRFYVIAVSGVDNVSSSAWDIGWGGAFSPASAITTASNGSHAFIVSASGATTTLALRTRFSASAIVDVGLVTVKELPGFHATQATAANRPTYGIVPKTGRRNILVGTATMATQTRAVTAAQHTLSFRGTGTVTLTGASTSGPLVGAGANDIVSLTFTPTAGNLTMTVSGTVNDAQLELGAARSAYQRVTTQFDVTEAGVASDHYLFFGGSTDPRWMVTPTITPGIDKVQVFAGVRKLSDSAAYQVIVEHSPSLAANNGAFILAPAVGTYEMFSKGTTQTSASGSGFPAPITNVVTGLGDISGDRVTTRVNGTQVAQSTTDQGTGNFLAYPAYIGARAGSSLYLNAQLFQLITRFGPNLPTPTTQQTERFVAEKTPEVTL